MFRYIGISIFRYTGNSIFRYIESPMFRYIKIFDTISNTNNHTISRPSLRSIFSTKWTNFFVSHLIFVFLRPDFEGDIIASLSWRKKHMLVHSIFCSLPGIICISTKYVFTNKYWCASRRYPNQLSYRVGPGRHGSLPLVQAGHHLVLDHVH